MAININIESPEVLKTKLGITPAKVRQITTKRGSNPGGIISEAELKIICGGEVVDGWIERGLIEMEAGP